MKNKILSASLVFISMFFSFSLVISSTSNVLAISKSDKNNFDPNGLVEEIKYDADFKSDHTYMKTESESGETYESKNALENSVLAIEGTINLSNVDITKSGDTNDKDADKYGLNSAVLAIEESKIKLMGGKIETSGLHANALFAYGTSTIETEDLNIKTNGKYSDAIVAAQDGTIRLTNTKVETFGESSSIFKTTNENSIIIVSGGEFITNREDSPIINTVKDLTITNKANFIAKKSNFAELVNDGNLVFKRSKIEVRNKDVFYVENGLVDIKLDATEIKLNNETKQSLLSVLSEKKNKSQVKLSLTKSLLYGNITSDEKSELSIAFKERTQYTGAINTKNANKNIALIVDSRSRIILTGDSYVNELSNEVHDNSNIYSNGHKLFVNGKEVSINQSTPEYWEYDFSVDSTIPVVIEQPKDKTMIYVALVVAVVAFCVSLTSVVIIKKKNDQKKQAVAEARAIAEAEKNTMKKPWEIKAAPIQKPGAHYNGPRRKIQ